MESLLTPKNIELLMAFAEKGGLALALVIILFWLSIEIRRNSAKDKLIAEKDKENALFQTKMLEVIGEVKTAVSNGNLLLEMLTRGRK